MEKIIAALNKKIAAAEKHCASNRKREKQLVVEGSLFTDNGNATLAAEYNRLIAQDLWLRSFLSTANSAVIALKAARRFELEL